MYCTMGVLLIRQAFACHLPRWGKPLQGIALSTDGEIFLNFRIKFVGELPSLRERVNAPLAIAGLGSRRVVGTGVLDCPQE